MTFEEFNAFCRSLPATTYVVQWGGSHVWKVGGKVFAIGSDEKDGSGYTRSKSRASPSKSSNHSPAYDRLLISRREG